MSKVTEIIAKYTDGKATLEETNGALKEVNAGFHLDPLRNTFTGEELLKTKADTAETANGFGLLDSGTGTLDKVEVRNGELVNCDMGESYALVIIAGKTFHVNGKKLVETEPAQDTATIPARPDMRRRKDLAGQVVRQTTKAGVYDVTYNEDGYAVKSAHVRFN